MCDLGQIRHTSFQRLYDVLRFERKTHCSSSTKFVLSPNRQSVDEQSLRPQRVPDKLIKYKEKTEMRETPKKPDLTGNLQ